MQALRSFFTIALVASLSVASVACRSASSGDDDDDDTADAGTGDTTIYQIQDPAEAMADGTPVEVRDVVVVAIDTFGGRQGSIYVMEPGGGAYSGVLVKMDGAGAANIAVGDIIDVEGGVKDEFTLEEDECERTSDCTITQIGTALQGEITLTKVGEGTVPEPELLNSWDLGTDDSEAEKWEGVLIKFENVRAFSEPFNVTSTDDTLKEMHITGPFRAGASLTELPTPSRRATALPL